MGSCSNPPSKKDGTTLKEMMDSAVAKHALAPAEETLAQQLQQVETSMSNVLKNATAMIESLRSQIELGLESSVCDNEQAVATSNQSFKERLRGVMTDRSSCSQDHATITFMSSDGSTKNASSIPVAIQNSFYSEFVNPSVPYLQGIRFTEMDGSSMELAGERKVGDGRRSPSFLNASQARKKLLVVMDNSMRLRGEEGCARMKQVVNGLVDTLLPNDVVMLYTSSSSMTVTRGFTSASYHNKLILQSMISDIECDGALDSYLWQKELQNASSYFNSSECSSLVCSVVAVSDFRLQVSSSLRSSMADLNYSSSHVHFFMFAISPQMYNLKAFSCLLKGVEFHFSQWNHSSTRDQSSYLLDVLTDYFIIMAAPLAASPELSISLPYASACGRTELIAISTPCFQNRNSSSPQLLGVVTVELVYNDPTNTSFQGLRTHMLNVRMNKTVLNAHQSFQVFQRSVSPGVLLVSEEALASYHGRNQSVASVAGDIRYSLNEWTGGQLLSSGKLLDILSLPWGSDHQILTKRELVNLPTWLFEPQPNQQINLTYTWRHMKPYTLLVLVTSWQIYTPGKRPESLRLTSRVNTLLSLSCNDSVRCLSWSPAQPMVSSIFIPPSRFVSPMEVRTDGEASLRQAACASSHNTSECDKSQAEARGWEALLKVLNSVVYHSSRQMTGGGVTSEAYLQARFSALVESAWNLTRVNARCIDSVFFSTNAGVYRKLSVTNQSSSSITAIDPTRQPWFTRGLLDSDALHLTPSTLSSSLLLSQSLPYEGTGGAPGVVGVVGLQLCWDALRRMMFEAESFEMRGRVEMNVCNRNVFPGNRCYLIDKHALILLDASSSSPVKQFLGEKEPAVVQVLVEEQVLDRVLDTLVVSSEAADSSTLAYKVAEHKLPFSSDRLGGSDIRRVSVVGLKSTNGLLLLLEGAEAGKVSQQLLDPVQALLEVRRPSVAASVSRGLEDLQQATPRDVDVSASERLFLLVLSLQDCPPGMNSTNFTALSAVLAFVLATLLLPACCARSHRKQVIRRHLLHLPKQDTRASFGQMKSELLLSIKRHEIGSVDDYYQLMEMFARLLRVIVDDKWQNLAKLRGELTDVLLIVFRLRLLVTNLKSRIEAHESSYDALRRGQPSRLETDIQTLVSAIEDCLESIDVEKINLEVDVREDAEGLGGSLQMQEEEKHFYSEFYQHLFDFPHDHTGSQSTASVMWDDSKNFPTPRKSQRR